MSSSNVVRIVITEMHTAGAPLRIVEKGYPDVVGETILDKQRYIRENLDQYRKLVIHEPRGHYGMYGVILVSPDIPGADIGAIFIDNAGYSTMCGHAVISLARYLVDKKIVKNPTTPETKVGIQCPCGLVKAFVEYNCETKKTSATRFQSVPAFVFATDFKVAVEGYGDIVVDIVYGGAFYAIVPVQKYGYDLGRTSVHLLRDVAGSTTEALRKILSPKNPENKDTATVYGTILTDGIDEFSDLPTANLCVYADNAVDRAPCGSGITARIALQYYHGQIKIGQKRTFVSPIRSSYVARVIKEVTYGKFKRAVIVEVSGRGYYTGSSVYTIEDGDDIGRGFLLC